MQLCRYINCEIGPLSESWDLKIQYGTDEQARKDVMLQLKNFNTKPNLFADPEDTITLQDLDDDFLNAEVDSLTLELTEG